MINRPRFTFVTGIENRPRNENLPVLFCARGACPSPAMLLRVFGISTIYLNESKLGEIRYQLFEIMKFITALKKNFQIKQLGDGFVFLFVQYLIARKNIFQV
eukprot:410875_1